MSWVHNKLVYQIYNVHSIMMINIIDDITAMITSSMT